MSVPEFTPWPKIARLNRDVIVTEKVDGTNAAIVIPEDDSGIFAQSRKKMISPGKNTDNYGFAGWVKEREEQLRNILGYGIHFGEWYGEGIQKNPLGITGKRFMLFNTTRWGGGIIAPDNPLGIEVATVLYQGPFNTTSINSIVAGLRATGSVHVPGGKAEGVVVYHTAADIMFKVLCENDEGWKG